MPGQMCDQDPAMVTKSIYGPAQDGSNGGDGNDWGFADIPPQATREPIIIPQALIDAGFLFCRASGKRPIGKGWTVNGYAHDDEHLLFHLKHHRNYGVIGDASHVILDLDTPELVDYCRKHLPETFCSISGSHRGMHRYYIVDRPLRNINLEKDGTGIGHIKGLGGMCIGPGSIHPETKLRYEVVYNIPVASITCDELLEALSPYIPEKTETAPREKSTRTTFSKKDEKWYTNLTLSDVGAYPVNPNQSGGEVFGEHPIHGSTSSPPKRGSVNFWINPSKNVWRCFACDSGGGPLEFFAVAEGLVECRDCTRPSPLRDKTLFKEVKRRLIDRALGV